MANDGMMQNEFNVGLPGSRKSAAAIRQPKPNVKIVNIAQRCHLFG